MPVGSLLILAYDESEIVDQSDSDSTCTDRASRLAVAAIYRKIPSRISDGSVVSNIKVG